MTFDFKPYEDAIESIPDADFMSGDVQGGGEFIIIVSHHDGHMNTYMGDTNNPKSPEEVKAEIIAYHKSLHDEH